MLHSRISEFITKLFWKSFKMDFDDEDLEIDSKTPNNNDYNAVVGMQESSMPLARPSTVQRNVIGRQNSGKFYFKNGNLDALQF